MKYMKERLVQETTPGNEDAAAEIIGALLLVAVISVTIGMVALVVFSGSSYVETPALRVDITNEEGVIDLIHQGGDTLYRETTQILVDGVDRTDDFEIPGGDAWSTFSVGDYLVSSIPCTGGTTIQIISTDSRNPTVIESLTCGPGIPPPVANFTFSPASGYISQMFSFTDLSTGDPDSLEWDFGDGEISIEQNPTHIYNTAGIYDVKLKSCNEGGCNSTTKTLTVFGFSDFVTNESVFVYGTKLFFKGRHIEGKGSTVIITGDLSSDELDGGTDIHISNIYVNGSVDLGNKNNDLGSITDLGLIYITGDLNIGSSDIVYGNEVYVGGNVVLYSVISGDLYTNGDLDFNNGNINKETHVNGDLNLNGGGQISNNIYTDGNLAIAGWCPNIYGSVFINYTGSLSSIGGCNYLLGKCHKVDSVPEFSMPVFLDIPIPSLKLGQWYEDHGYVNTPSLVNGIKIFDDTSYSTEVTTYGSAENVVIVSGGDIDIYVDRSDYKVTGVFFAPNGKVTFHDNSYFEGVVIARDGFYVLDGGSRVYFEEISNYISNPDNYPF